MVQQLRCVFVANGEMHAKQIRTFLEAAGIPAAERGESLRHAQGSQLTASAPLRSASPKQTSIELVLCSTRLTPGRSASPTMRTCQPTMVACRLRTRVRSPRP